MITLRRKIRVVPRRIHTSKFTSFYTLNSKMSLTRSITFNNVTASITLPTELNNDNQLDWTITMTSGNNVVSTSGTVDIVVPESEPIPVPTSVPAPTSVPISLPTLSEENKKKHIAVIKMLLDMSETLKGKESKAVAAIKILDYVSNDALEFTKSNERFLNTLIKKCYEFKRVNSDMPDVVEKANTVLTKLGKCTCGVCCSLSSLVETTNTVVQPVAKQVSETTKSVIETAKPVAETTKPVVEAVKSVATTVADGKYNPDMPLFLTIAHEHDVSEPSRYWTYYENAVKWGNVPGATKAEQMNNYFNQFSKLGARTELMKSLFEKNKLVFNDSVIAQYMKWIKTYNPPGKTNRYKNMCAFIDANRSLFTA